MVEGLWVSQAQVEVQLEWWRRNWKEILLLLGLAVLWSFSFDPDPSEPQHDFVEGDQTIAIVEMPGVVPVHCKPLNMIS